MASFVSLKQILLTQDVLDKDASKRGPSFEFQDYAYRLAKDLNDLENLPIYMRLTRRIDRSLIERAYSFVADSNSDRKGQLFLWKLKNIRDGITKERDLKDYSYQSILNKTKILRNKIAKELIKKNNENYEKTLGLVLDRYFTENIDNLKGKKILTIGNDSEMLAAIALAKGMKIYGIDTSLKLTKLLKDSFSFTTKPKFITKDFLKNTYPNKCFDLIVVNNMFTTIPFEAENKFISEISKVLCDEGKVILGTNIGENDFQSWKEITLGGEEFLSFKKINSLNVEEKFEVNNLEILNRFDFDKISYYYLSK